MGHRFTYVVSPEEERENLTVEWFLPGMDIRAILLRA